MKADMKVRLFDHTGEKSVTRTVRVYPRHGFHVHRSFGGQLGKQVSRGAWSVSVNGLALATYLPSKRLATLFADCLATIPGVPWDTGGTPAWNKWRDGNPDTVAHIRTLRNMAQLGKEQELSRHLEEQLSREPAE